MAPIGAHINTAPATKDLFMLWIILAVSSYNAGITNNVITDAVANPNIIVYASPAKNSSCLATELNQTTVVSVVKMIGCSLDFPVSITASERDIHLLILLFALSINTIASLTTIPVSAINPIPNDILYGFPVIRRPIFVPNNPMMMLYMMMTGCKKLLNCNMRIA